MSPADRYTSAVATACDVLRAMLGARRVCIATCAGVVARTFRCGRDAAEAAARVAWIEIVARDVGPNLGRGWARRISS